YLRLLGDQVWMLDPDEREAGCPTSIGKPGPTSCTPEGAARDQVLQASALTSRNWPAGHPPTAARRGYTSRGSAPMGAQPAAGRERTEAALPGAIWAHRTGAGTRWRAAVARERPRPRPRWVGSTSRANSQRSPRPRPSTSRPPSVTQTRTSAR